MESHDRHCCGKPWTCDRSRCQPNIDLLAKNAQVQRPNSISPTTSRSEVNFSNAPPDALRYAVSRKRSSSFVYTFSNSFLLLVFPIVVWLYLIESKYATDAPNLNWKRKTQQRLNTAVGQCDRNSAASKCCYAQFAAPLPQHALLIFAHRWKCCSAPHRLLCTNSISCLPLMFKVCM